jgi:Winged helix DNA-binding domain
LTGQGIARRRLAAQRLVGQPLPSAADAVRHLVAVQSQDYAGAKWALAQRTPTATEAELDAAFDAGSFFRIHVLRPTWHFVAPGDLRWLTSLTGPRVHQASAFQYRLLEIDDVLARRAADVFERVLTGGGAMTREELGAELRAAGFEATGLRLVYLVSRAEVDAILCSGPRRDGKQTFALVDERIPPTPERTRDEALAELAGRYVVGHGPAQDIDFAWWSGLTLRDARRGLETASPALDREVLEGRTFWVAARSVSGPGSAPAAGSTVHLLPNYDELLVAFRDRSDGLDPGLPPRARIAEEILNHVIVRDGLMVGRWRRPLASGAAGLRLDPLVALDSDERRLLAAAVERYSAFVGRPVEVAGLD